MRAFLVACQAEVLYVFDSMLFIIAYSIKIGKSVGGGGSAPFFPAGNAVGVVASHVAIVLHCE